MTYFDLFDRTIKLGDWLVRPYVDYRTPKMKFCKILRINGGIQSIGYHRIYDRTSIGAWIQDQKKVGGHGTRQCVLIKETSVPKDVLNLYNNSKYVI